LVLYPYLVIACIHVFFVSITVFGVKYHQTDSSDPPPNFYSLP
jgi:hypothetical protein